MSGKHTAKKKRHSFKFFIIILVLFLIAIGYNFIVDTNLPDMTNTNNTAPSDEWVQNTNEEIVKTKTVENADYLEITGLDITTKDGFSTIKTTIKNNSTDTLTDFSLTISIFDANNNLITELLNPIQSIKPNESVEAFGIVNDDISNTFNYIVKKN